MSLAERRGLRLFAFCALYVAQGIPWGFTAITLPAYLGAKHMDAAVVGTTLAMTTLPYTFKIFWAPIVDAFPSKRFGKRRPWIIGAQLMMAVTIGAMIAIPDLTRDLKLLAWMIFIHTIFNSIQDLSTDALAVDLLDEDERGRTNGFMYASKYFGGILGAAGMSTLIAEFGMRTALVAQTVVLLAIMMIPVLCRERDEDATDIPVAAMRLDARGRLREVWSSMVELARSSGATAALLGGIVMLLSNLGTGLLAATAPVLFTQDLDWTFESYSQLTGGPGLAVGLAGSVLGGLLADRVGHRRLAAIGGAVLGAFWVIWALLAPFWHSHTLVYALVAVEPLCQSVMTVSLFAMCMDLAWPRLGATHFGIYMALANWSTTIGFKLAGFASDTWTYPGIYIAGAVLQLAMLAVLPFVDTRAVRRALEAT